MTERGSDLSGKLADLGARIQRKLDEFHKEGISHADAHRAALDMKIEHARLDALDKAKREGSPHPERDATLAAEVEALRLSFEKWLTDAERGT